MNVDLIHQHTDDATISKGEAQQATYIQHNSPWNRRILDEKYLDSPLIQDSPCTEKKKFLQCR